LLPLFLHRKVQGSYWLFQAVTNVGCVWKTPTAITEVAYGCPQFCKAVVNSVPWINLVMPQHFVKTA
jgi:predicted thioredoxin/glutaredoxin